MSSSRALEFLREREALALKRLSGKRAALLASALGARDEGEPRALFPGAVLLPLGLAAGAGFLLAPKRARAGQASPGGGSPLAAAGWVLAASRLASAVTHLGAASGAPAGSGEPAGA